MTDEEKTILIVDDEQDIRDYLSCLLEDNGYRTITADDGLQGLAVLENAPIDLVSLDINMPRKSGIGLYRDMRQVDTWRRIPVIIVSGVAAEFERFISIRKDIPSPEGIIHKPVDQAKLLAIVRKLLP